MAKNGIFPMVARIAPILRLTVFLFRTVFEPKFTILTSNSRRFLPIFSLFGITFLAYFSVSIIVEPFSYPKVIPLSYLLGGLV